MASEKYAFTDRSPSRWSYFAIIDPADSTVWTQASIRGDGLVTTDFGTYDVADPRLTYWTPLPDLPVSKPVTTEKTVGMLSAIDVVVALPRQVILTAVLLAMLAYLIARTVVHWLIVSTLTTCSWLVTPNKTWKQEFADLTWMVEGKSACPANWDKQRTYKKTLEGTFNHVENTLYDCE